MFTGIIESVGEIVSIEKNLSDIKLTIDVKNLDKSDLRIGDSVACNGVCLTVVKLVGNLLVADVSEETLKLTTLGRMRKGNRINLEKALTPTTRLGGHLVSGHVDAVGEVVAVKKISGSVQYKIKAPQEIAHYIAKKGSICVDGVSLTVNEISKNIFELNLVSHTLKETTAGDYNISTQVNLEVDLLARYLERLLSDGQPAGGKFFGKKLGRGSNMARSDVMGSGVTGSAITNNFLQQHGFQ